MKLKQKKIRKKKRKIPETYFHVFVFQFLKKVQRQERIVEEIKTVLKPHYNRKRITKEDYKNILRKCVPKVCKWHFRISKVDLYLQPC